MKQFYGIEEFLDLSETLPAMLDQLDKSESEFGFITALSNLDIWYIKVTNIDKQSVWNPFQEPLSSYSQRHQMLIAHIYADKQWPNSEIIQYARAQTR